MENVYLFFSLNFLFLKVRSNSQTYWVFQSVLLIFSVCQSHKRKKGGENRLITKGFGGSPILTYDHP